MQICVALLTSISRLIDDNKHLSNKRGKETAKRIERGDESDRETKWSERCDRKKQG